MYYWEKGEEPQFEDEVEFVPEALPPATGVSNRWLGLMLFMALEAMLFVILLFAFLYLRSQGDGWPPPGIPRLDPTWPFANLLVLLLSGVLAWSAERSIRRYRITTAEKQLLLAAALGAVFLVGQAREYAVLLLNGVSAASGLYSGVFILTMAFHGLHVLSGLVWLVWVWYLTRYARQTPEEHFGVQGAAVYWGFVSSVWVLLFLLLYT